MIRAIFSELDDTLCNFDKAWNCALEETFRLLSKHQLDLSFRDFMKAFRITQAPVIEVQRMV